MKSAHLTRRPPATGKRFTWARIPTSETGPVCYRLFRRDVTGAQHIATLDFSRGTTRSRIAETVNVKRHDLLASVDAFDLRSLGVEA